MAIRLATPTISAPKIYQSIPTRIDLAKSYFLIVGGDTKRTTLNTTDYKVVIEGVWQDIAQLKLLLSSDLINFKKEHIEVLFAPTKAEFKDMIETFLKTDAIENLFLFFSVRTFVDADNADFEIGLKDNETVKISELYNYLGKTEINLIIFFDGDNGETFFEKFYKRNAFILSSVGKDEQSRDTKDGGILVQGLASVINEGMDNHKEYLTLSEIFMGIREKQYLKYSIEPRLFTTNTVQFLEFAKNKKYDQSAEVLSFSAIKNLIGKSYLDKALKALKDINITDQKLKDGVLILTQEYNELSLADILGKLEDKSIKYANFSERLIRIINLVEQS